MRRPTFLPVMFGLVLVVLAGRGDIQAGRGAAGQAGAAAGPPASPSPATSAVLPAGWRWEAYGSVQVGVPGDWGYAEAGTEHVTTGWCGYGPVDRVVARPGSGAMLAGCGGARNPNRIPVTGLFVALGPGGVAGTVDEGDRTTVVLPGGSVAVQAPLELRRRIVATVHSIEQDSNGCPVDHPISLDPGRTPDPAVAVGSLADVSAVVACKYAVVQPGRPGGPGLWSSVRFTGAAAQAAIDRIAAASRGGGPDAPSTCAVDYSYGEDIMVLSITSGTTTSEIYLRYSGCDHNGFDDGIAVRSLTAAAVRPFFTGANNGGGGLSGPWKKVEMICPEC